MIPSPDGEAAARIERIAAWFREHAHRIWNVDLHAGQGSYQPPPNPHMVATIGALRACYDATIDALKETWAEADLTTVCAEVFAFPAAARLRPTPSDGSLRAWLPHHAAWTTAAVWTAEHPTEGAARLVALRIRHLAEHVFEDTEVPLVGAMGHEYAYLLPALRECLALLGRLSTTAAAREVMLDLVRLRHDVPITPPADESFRRTASSAWGWEVRGADLTRSYQAHYATLAWAFRGFYDVLARHGQLDAETFERAVRRLPLSFPDACLSAAGHVPGEPPSRELRDLARDLMWRVAQRLDDDDVRLLDAGRGQTAPEGGRWLVQACALIERLGLEVVSAREYRGHHRAIRAFARIGALAEGDDPDELVRALSRFRASTLQAVLPISGVGQVPVLRALGWERAQRLLGLLLTVRNVRFADASGTPHPDAPNSADPSSGVVDPAEVRAAVDEAGPDIARALLAAFRRAQDGFDNTLVLFEAACGWNREAILDKVNHDSQIALKAFGLLPLERGAEEVLERYLALQAAQEEASRYGAERAVNTRAAAEAGLANLAAVAGYSDPSRLEWAMESRVGSSVAPLGAPRKVGAWTVELALFGLAPRLIVRKGGRTLPSVPAGLRRAAEYEDMKAAAAHLKAQLARFRRAFEAFMVGEEPLAAAERRGLQKVPAAEELLQRLVLRTREGRSGMFDRERGRLLGHDGAELDPEDVLTIAHCDHLFREGTLGAWQHEIVERRLVQPFKQAFRELYVLTPAERETRTWTGRFAGHVLDSRIATRLLQARGWQIGGGDSARPFRRFRGPSLTAWFAFPDAGHFLGETPAITSDRIVFRRNDAFAAGGEIPLAEVPPIVFSEAMRDADLVVSIAGGVETRPWSDESCERRAELIRVVAAVLGLAHVTCDSHFAHIRGTRSRYRLHLGSAAVHLEPGDFVCIVPDPPEGADPLYLPFADEDPKTVEVISKVLLLAHDERITDETILRQIAAWRCAVGR
ncbi:MAG TPA: DUF4132 domain-containing protein [Vicinamibacteria bacterium]